MPLLFTRRRKETSSVVSRRLWWTSLQGEAYPRRISTKSARYYSNRTLWTLYTYKESSGNTTLPISRAASMAPHNSTKSARRCSNRALCATHTNKESSAYDTLLVSRAACLDIQGHLSTYWKSSQWRLPVYEVIIVLRDFSKSAR